MRNFEEPGTKRWHEKSGPDETGSGSIADPAKQLYPYVYQIGYILQR
jgi:hypothetical protein